MKQRLEEFAAERAAEKRKQWIDQGERLVTKEKEYKRKADKSRRYS